MKGFLVFVVIICMALLVGAQEIEEVVEVIEEVVVEQVQPAQPVEVPVTRLNVTIIDGVNDKLIKLENCIVQIIGELHIVNDSYPYQKTFTEGDRYEITIHFRPKE